jgi:glutamate racemase
MDIHVLVTDSGLGGLAVCAEMERSLRHASPSDTVQLTYFNAWPDESGGYNSMPDPQSRARVFELALRSMKRYGPDLIVIACNTLSVIYERTEFGHNPPAPVMGIIDAGVGLFLEAMHADPPCAIVLFGTRTTMESGIHRGRLIQEGILPGRIISQACHGLAAAIEADPGSPEVAGLIERFAAEACPAEYDGARLYAGLCCTHYSYVAGLIQAALQRLCGRPVRVLDPVRRLAERAASALGPDRARIAGRVIPVRVVSKVRLEESQRRAIGARIRPVSEATAGALLSYAHVPDLF